MTSEPPDPDHLKDESSDEDGWGDAVQVVKDDSGGGTVLPTRRESKEKRVVTVIEHDPDPHQTPDQDDHEQAVTKLEVHEYVGRKAEKVLRPDRPNMAEMGEGGSNMLKSLRERWEIEKAEWTQTHTFNVRWIIGIVVGIIALIAGGLALLPWINRLNDQSVAERQVVLRAEKLAAAERQYVTEALLKSADQAKSIFRNFVSARVGEDILPSLRDKNDVEPLVREWLINREAQESWSPDTNTKWNIIVANQQPVGVLSGLLPNYEEFIAYFVYEHDSLLLDWKATTGFGTATFRELGEGRGDGSEIRGVLSPSVFYTDVYPEADYQCYQLLEPAGDQVIWCYIARESEINQALARLFVGGAIVSHEVGPVRITLRLSRGKEGSIGKQWLIDGVVHEEWVRLSKAQP